MTRTPRLAGPCLAALALVSAASAQAGFDTAEFFPLDTPGLRRARAVGDVDGDGDVDVLWFEASGYQVLRNDLGTAGRFTWLPEQATGITWGSGVPVVGDFQGDGLPDLAYAGAVGGTPAVRIRPGDGAGNPVGGTTLTFSGTRILALVAADFDGDGEDELAVAREVWPTFQNQDKEVRIRLVEHDGAGGFVRGPSFSLGPPAELAALVATDVEGDGVPDLVALWKSPFEGTWTVQVLPVVGGAATAGPVLSTGLAYASLVAGDADGDGDTDLVLARATVFAAAGVYDYELLVLEQDDLGGFAGVASEPASLGAAALGMLPRPVLGDRDGDGDLDVLDVWGEAYLLENDGSNRFALAARPLVEKDDSFRGPAAALADLDGDGLADVVAPRAVLRGPEAFEDSPAALPGTGTELFEALDWEGDGDVDLVHFDGSVSVNDGAGGFQELLLELPDAPPGFRLSARSSAIDDLDGDGLPDHLVRFFELVPDPVFGQVPEFRSLRLVRGTPAGGLEDAGPATAPGFPDDFLQGSGFQRAIDVDVDGDGDFLGAGHVWLNDGGGAFTRQPTAPSDGISHAGDVDGDGDVDLLVFDDLGGSLAYRLLRAQGGFQYASEALVTVADGGSGARFLDLDVDGDLDVAIPRSYLTAGDRITVLENAGGVLSLHGELQAGAANAAFVRLADVDLDGRLDLVTGNPRAFPGSNASGDVAVLRRTAGLAYEPVRQWVGRGVLGVLDLDGDGDVDVVGQGTRLLDLERSGPSAGSIRQTGVGEPGRGGVAPVLGGSGPLVPGSRTAALHLVRAVGGTVAFIAVSEAAPPGPTPGRIGPAGGLTPLLFLRLAVGGAPGVPAVGAADVPLRIPLALAGRTFVARALVVDRSTASGFSVSNDLELGIGGD